MPNILLEAINVKKHYGERAVLDIDRLSIFEGDRIGLVGENGAGKSTLLAILAGIDTPDEGRVVRHCPTALIRQTGATADPIDARSGRLFRAAPEHEGLSGGELTRRRIAGALSADAPLLLADEPTTDLDAEGVARLREQLSSHRGALLLVSHDRALLNALCGRIWHLEDGRITDFPGDYDAWQAELSARRAFQQFEYEQYRAEQARLRAASQRMNEWAASVKKAPKRMGNSEARLHTHEYTNAVLRLSHSKQKFDRRLERLEKKERLRDLPDIRMALGVARPIAAKTALSVECRRLSAGGRTLINDAAFVLPTGSRTALTGVNGAGKSSLLRAIRGTCPPGLRFEGRVRFNPAARVGWFDQDHAEGLDLRATALENAMSESALPESVARTALARLNLRGDDVFKPAGALSGGERARVALARLLLGDFNLLVLDEPTNHLDVFTLEALEALLSGYGGTLLFVSHDRAFIDAVATRVLAIESGRLETFEGTLSQREAEARRSRDDEARQLEISALEMRMAALAGRMASPRKGDKPDKLSEAYDALAAELRALKRG